MTLCSTVQQPRKPKSCRREGSRSEAAPASALSSKAASMTSRARRLSVATVVGYLRNTSHHFQLFHFAEVLSVTTVVGYLRNT